MKKNYFNRKEQIILSAIEIIDELGINGLSIREIAKKQDITEGALYRHFKSKNHIIIEAVRYYAHFDINIMNTIKKNNMDSKSAIIFFLNSISEYYENYPEITAIDCSFESLMYEPDISDEVIQLIEIRVNFLKSIIENGKNTGEFKSCINSEDLSDTIIGLFRYLIFKWRLKKYSFSLKEKTLYIINIILKSALSSC